MMRTTLRRGLKLSLSLILAVSFLPSFAEAQYFGRNKVQYKTFRFEVLNTEHFDIYFYPEEEDGAREAARMAERWYARLSRILSHDLSGRQPIILYASHADFEQTNTLPNFIEEGVGGVTEGLKRRIVLPLAATLGETDHVIGHELVHAFQYDIAGTRDQDLYTVERLPLWMIEGMAEFLSVGPVDPHTAMWIRDAAREEELPDIKHLDDPDLFPYRWGQALWAYLAGRLGDQSVGEIYREALKNANGPAAISTIVGEPVDQVSEEWHQAIHAQYDPILQRTAAADTYGDRLSREDRPSRLEASPVLSPDGRRIVYFSERSLLSVDLYLADVDTGTVIRRLVSTSLNPHFTSLQFIGSAGSWSPDGRQFVLGAVRKGEPTLAFIDVDSGRVVREIPFPALGEVVNPSWSPDGNSIAFSATHGGHSDLFLYDLRDDALDEITEDAFADLQPAWSPDGSRIAFVTDRFSTTLSLLRSGAYRLAIFDPTTRDIQEVTTFPAGKSINPQWAPDGVHLYFLSDQSGLTNIYVIDLGTGAVSAVTNLNTGASGITPLSPALSLAADANRLAFSAYDTGRVGIYVIRDAGRLEGGEDASGVPGVEADILPPQQRASTQLSTLLSDATTGLPSELAAPGPYHAHLSLDAVGEPYVGVGVSSLGAGFGGGISLTWSDLLGNQNLLAAVDANTYGMGIGDLLKNTGGLIAYQSLGHRWNWGIVGGQSPSLAAGFASGVGTIGGQSVFVEQQITQRQTYRSVDGILSYPFSQVRRVQFSGGYANVSFDEEIRTIVSSLQNGQILSDQTVNNQIADPLHLVETSVAAVGDSATFGATSPVAGERSHVEFAPTFGSIRFSSVIADYRRYIMPVNFYTFALRALHVGRYGSGGEDSRLLPLFIGYPELVRGYTVGSFTAADCTSGPGTTCQEFDRLLGSRILVGNAELRFPVLRPFGVRSGMYGPVPVEIAAFADGGVAWNRGEKPSFLGGDRQGVGSTGVTFRINVLGFAVAQIDFVHPFQRSAKSWLWEFSLNPGY